MAFAVLVVVYLAVIVLEIAAMWAIFAKAAQPGWAAIVPIYNTVILLKIVGRPVWWIVLLLIPFANLIVGIILCIDLAKSFGRSAGFGAGIALLGLVFVPILGFGSAQYRGPAAASAAIS